MHTTRTRHDIQILVLPPEQIKQHGPNYHQLALGGLAVPSSTVQRSASFIAANRRPTFAIRGPIAPAPVVAAAGAAPPVTIVVDSSEPPQVVAGGDDDVSTGVRGEEQEGEELLVGAYTIATLRQKWAETASEPLSAESSETSSGSGTPRTDPTTTPAQADGEPPARTTEKRKRKEKKKKGRNAYSSRRLYVDVLRTHPPMSCVR
jgi:hypothetical protein